MTAVVHSMRLVFLPSLRNYSLSLSTSSIEIRNPHLKIPGFVIVARGPPPRVVSPSIRHSTLFSGHMRSVFLLVLASHESSRSHLPALDTTERKNVFVNIAFYRSRRLGVKE